MNRPLLRVLLSMMAIVGIITLSTSIASAQDGRRLRAGYASLSGNMAPYWAAKDSGLYKKYGLDIDLVAFPSGTEGMAAMIAGEIEFLAIAGSTTASAAIGGADVVSLAITTERLVTSLMTIPSIQRAEELKGKAVGISRFGTSIDTAARMALHHYGLEAMKDVMLVQVGAVSSGLASLRGGRIQGAILSYPALIQARREGFRELLDIASLGVPYASTGITVRKSFMAQRRDVVVNYVKSILEATARIKRDKAFTIEMMMKYFRTKDREMMEETYEVSVAKYLKRVPTPTAESFRTVIDELALVNPKAKGQDPKRFYDESILQELDKSGFINALNR
ncbi:MAG: ABC transporter substrate-binding protein [Candidatus Binatia bacterium]